MKISNKTLFSLHGWLGLNLGFLLFVICFSGTIATLSYELDWLLDSEIRPVAAAEGEERISLASAYHNVQALYPRGNIYAIRSPSEDYLALQVFLRDLDSGEVTVYLDPFTGAVLAARDRMSIKNFFRIFHKQLFIVPTKFTFNGMFIVGLFGLSLLVTVVTGFLLLGNWLKNLFRLRWRKGLRVFFVDWHHSTGLWSLLFSFLFALTGIWYWLEKVTDISEVALAKENQVVYEQKGLLLDAPNPELYIQKAQAALPGLEVKAFFFPFKAGDPVHVFGQAEAMLVRDAANYVALDPYSGKVLQVRNATDLGLLDRWLHTVDPLHFGTFGGLWTKLIWFFFGLLISLAILVGFYLWFRRIVNSQKIKAKGVSRLAICAHVISISLLILSTLFSVVGMKRMGSGVHDTHKIAFNMESLGPWQGYLQQKINSYSQTHGHFELVFNDARPNLKAASLYVHMRNQEDVIKADFKLDWYGQKAQLDIPSLQSGQSLDKTIAQWYESVASLSLVLEDQQGNFYEHRLTSDELLSAVPNMESLPLGITNNRAVKYFILSFLLFIWLGLFFWVGVHMRIYRKAQTEDQPLPATEDIADVSQDVVQA